MAHLRAARHGSCVARQLTAARPVSANRWQCMSVSWALPGGRQQGERAQRAQQGRLRRYSKGLPPSVNKMNTECLKLRPHDHPGYQTIAQIKARPALPAGTLLALALHACAGARQPARAAARCAPCRLRCSAGVQLRGGARPAGDCAAGSGRRP